MGTTVDQKIMMGIMWLSSSHIEKYKKALSTELVKNDILPNKPRFCILRDETKAGFFCEYYWSKRNEDECSITIEWSKFVKARDLKEGSKIRFFINNKDPVVVHVFVFAN